MWKVKYINNNEKGRSYNDWHKQTGWVFGTFTDNFGVGASLYGTAPPSDELWQLERLWLSLPGRSKEVKRGQKRSKGDETKRDVINESIEYQI